MSQGTAIPKSSANIIAKLGDVNSFFLRVGHDAIFSVSEIDSFKTSADLTSKVWELRHSSKISGADEWLGIWIETENGQPVTPERINDLMQERVEICQALMSACDVYLGVAGKKPSLEMTESFLRAQNFWKLFETVKELDLSYLVIGRPSATRDLISGMLLKLKAKDQLAIDLDSAAIAPNLIRMTEAPGFVAVMNASHPAAAVTKFELKAAVENIGNKTALKTFCEIHVIIALESRGDKDMVQSVLEVQGLMGENCAIQTVYRLDKADIYQPTGLIPRFLEKIAGTDGKVVRELLKTV